jgi:hypothetical protein
MLLLHSHSLVKCGDGYAKPKIRSFNNPAFLKKNNSNKKIPPPKRGLFFRVFSRKNMKTCNSKRLVYNIIINKKDREGWAFFFTFYYEVQVLFPYRHFQFYP